MKSNLRKNHQLQAERNESLLEKLHHSESTVWTMNRVLEYIQEHLHEPLTLEEISQVALLSKFHFHRIFKMVTSESLTQFIQRLRIEKAANIISTDSQITLTTVAMNCGFSSSGYFSRIFREYFGIRASTFRKLSMHEKQRFIQTHIKGLMPFKWLRDFEGELDVKIEMIPQMKVAYIRKFYFDLCDEPAIIHRMFDYIVNWAQDKGVMGQETKVLGIIHDNPYMTPFSKYQYDACITVTKDVPTEGAIGLKTIEAGRYAVLELRSVNKKKLESSIFTFLTSWLPESGYSIDDRPILEFYNDPILRGNFDMDFCIPIN